MTSFTDRHGDHLEILTRADGSLLLAASAITGGSRAVIIEPMELLAMIDSEAPDALRAYLRERSDLMDGPFGLEPLPATPEQLDAVPEADSPEDTDETDHVEKVRNYIQRQAGVTLSRSLLREALMPEGIQSGKGGAR